MLKDGDAFVQRLKLEQLRQWADEADIQEQKCLSLIKTAREIFNDPDQHPIYGYIPIEKYIRN